MTLIRFIIELLFAGVGVFFVVLGQNYQQARGVGLIIGSLMGAVFVIELFLSQRSKSYDIPLHDDLEAYVRDRLGFDYRSQAFMESNNITQKDVACIKEWYEEHQKEGRSYMQFWTKEFLERIPPLGMSWASGFTPLLDRFSREAVADDLQLDEHFFFSGYKKEIELAERILAQTGRNNVLLVGQEGVGQHFVLKGLEKLIETGRTVSTLNYKRFIWLDTDALLSGIHDQGELRERLEGVFHDVLYAGNIVLGIEKIDSFFDPAFPQIADVMIPFLQSDRSRVVATTNPAALASRLDRPDVLTQFAKVTIEEPSLRHTILALEEVAWLIERQEGMHIPYQVIKKVIELADRFSVSTPRPQKDIDLLQEVVSFVRNNRKNHIEVPDVVQVLSQRSGIPMGAVSEDEKQKLLHLEDTLRQKLIGQDEAIHAIANALKRARLEVRQAKRPIGSFLFLGPTGVGKTTAAKALAQLYFGKKEQMVRLDMSEYQKPEDAERLMEVLSVQIRQHPYSLLLLDELEKAHGKVLNLFLQILDEGIFTDAQGLKIDFRNLIVIATSNAGSEFIRTNIEQVNNTSFAAQLLDYLQKNNLFTPEFLNRFDAVVTFKPLDKEELDQIAGLMLGELAEQLKREHHLTLVISPELRAFLVERGYNPEYGARPMRRVMQDTLETVIAEKLLKGEFNKGDTLTIDPEQLETYVHP